ncbi:EthD family reductase [Paenarthrobacter nicotinovorans]|uniref:EthD family reductase n=1 Tax=Paenarthrobacter nicotinovorans TaxID=29320 RepID=UPI003805219E
MVPKRITYLEKRDGMSREDFRKHWSTIHADIARDLPGVVAYRQNHLYQASPDGSPTDGGFAVDGIVELWFADDSVVNAGFDSPVASRLAADEVNFLSGLVGGAVEAAEPYAPCPTKLWVLGRWMDAQAPDPGRVAAWADSQGAQWPGAGHVSVNFLHPEAPLLTRAALRSDPDLAQVAIAFSFEDGEAAAAAIDNVLEDMESALFGVVVNARAYLAEELVII